MELRNLEEELQQAIEDNQQKIKAIQQQIKANNRKIFLAVVAAVLSIALLVGGVAFLSNRLRCPDPHYEYCSPTLRVLSN